MQTLAQLAHSDLRSVYLMLGECCELGGMPEAWFRRLHERFSELIGARYSLFLDGCDDAGLGCSNPGAADRVSVFGWSPGDFAATMKDYFASEIFATDPSMIAWGRLAGARGEWGRCQRGDVCACVGGVDWYGV